MKEYISTKEYPEIEFAVTSAIQHMGIPANVMGYRYLRSAVMLAMDDTSVLDSVTKRLYPEVAKTGKTTAVRVERSIRNAISLAWRRGAADTDYFEKHLHCRIDTGGRKPTNSELIALISDSLRMTLSAKCAHAYADAEALAADNKESGQPGYPEAGNG